MIGSLSAEAGRTWKRLFNRHPVVRQYDHVDCGPACLLSVLRFHGGDTGLPRIRSWSGTDVNGTSLLGLQRAATALGFHARGAGGTYDDLLKERLPCIAHTVREGAHHYVVVYEVSRTRVRVGDPSAGIRELSRSDFEALWTERAVLLLEPGPDLISESPPHWFGWVFDRIRHIQEWLVQSVFLGVLYTVLGLATAVVVQRLIDEFISARDVSRILWAGGGLLTLYGARSLAGYLRQRFLVGLGKRASTSIASAFIAHLFRLPASYFDTRKRGDIIARLQDAAQVQTAVLQILGTTTIDLLIAVLSLVMVFYFSPAMGAIALLLLLPATLFAGAAVRQVYREQDAALGAYGALQASYVDAVDGIESIRELGVGQLFAQANLVLFGHFQTRVEKLGLTKAAVGFQVENVNGAMLATTLTVGAILVAAGQLQLGAMMASYSLIAGALPSLQRVIESVFTFQGGGAAAQRLQDLLLTDPEADTGSRPFTMVHALSLDRAHFSWPNGAPVLKEASLTLPRGRIVGLSGSNGSGKTTLVHLLTRRYPLGAGRLMVDATEAECIDLESYRGAVGVVPETVKIFHGTLGLNLTVGLADTQDTDLDLRIEELLVEPFIGRFRRGYRTMLGEDGRRLSAGERQMIGLIRVLLRRPSLLIIDEGLNALDPETYRVATRALSLHAREGSTLLISHHPWVLDLAHERYRLEGGRITPAAQVDPSHETAA